MYKFYHVTPTHNLANIQKNGLQPNIGDRSVKLEDKAGIYLFNSLDDAENALSNWLGDEFDEDEQLSLLQITSNNIKPNRSHYETVVDTNIPASDITVLTKDIDTFNFKITETFKSFYLRMRK